MKIFKALFLSLFALPFAAYAMVEEGCVHAVKEISSGVASGSYIFLEDQEITRLLAERNNNPEATSQIAISYIPMLIKITSEQLRRFGIDYSNMDDVVQNMLATPESPLIKIINRFQIEKYNSKNQQASLKDKLSAWISHWITFEIRREVVKILKSQSNSELLSENETIEKAEEPDFLDEGKELLEKLIPIVEEFLEYKKKTWTSKNRRPLEMMEAVVRRRWYGEPTVEGGIHEATFDEIGKTYGALKGSAQYAEVVLRRDFLMFLKFHHPEMEWLLNEWRSYLP